MKALHGEFDRSPLKQAITADHNGSDTTLF